MEEELPRFVPDEDQPEPGLVLGRLSTTTHAGEVWVDDRWLGYLTSGEERHPGRWRRREDRWAFEPERPDALERLRSRAAWSVLDAYRGDLYAFVLDRGRTWRRARYEPMDAVRERDTTRPADRERGEFGERVPGGWDHEHCQICWTTIGAGGEPHGWCADAHTWVCEGCHRRFVGPRSLVGLEEFCRRTPKGPGGGPGAPG